MALIHTTVPSPTSCAASHTNGRLLPVIMSTHLTQLSQITSRLPVQLSVNLGFQSSQLYFFFSTEAVHMLHTPISWCKGSRLLQRCCCYSIRVTLKEIWNEMEVCLCSAQCLTRQCCDVEDGCLSVAKPKTCKQFRTLNIIMGQVDTQPSDHSKATEWNE